MVAAKLACNIVAPALVFAGVHYPSRNQMLGCGLLGLAWAFFYLRDRNLYPLGLFHGWIATLFYFWYEQADPLVGTLSGY